VPEPLLENESPGAIVFASPEKAGAFALGIGAVAFCCHCFSVVS
jgi:hypothetical protein